jgi:cell division protein FtsZ
MENTFNNLAFDMPKNRSSVIKVIGVGGGGGNAVNHMYEQGIKGVDFVICNTDLQALQNSPIPNKIQLGINLTEGLGAGADPKVGAQAAVENIEQIKSVLSSNTKMLFITVGMGGGTGTGAAPVIAKVAKELGILTIGIVTIPFQFEGEKRSKQAQIGIESLREYVDSLIIVNNNKLTEIYGDLGYKKGYAKADEILADAAKGIAEVITQYYQTNIDFRDVNTVLKNSGSAIMGSAVALGENRAEKVIQDALDSPLLNDNKITGSKNVLLLIVSGEQEVTIKEIETINAYIHSEAKSNVNIIMGIGDDDSLGNSIKATIIATGFHSDVQEQLINIEEKKIIHTLDNDQELIKPLKPIISKHEVPSSTEKPKDLFYDTDLTLAEEPEIKEDKVIVHDLFSEEEEEETVDTIEQEMLNLINTTSEIKQFDVTYEQMSTAVIDEVSIEDDFIFTEIDEVVEEIVSEDKPNQLVFDFDMPIKAIEVQEEIVSKNAPIVEQATRFELEAEVQKPVAKKQTIESFVVEEPELIFEVKKAPVQEEKQEEQAPISFNDDPFDNPVDEVLKKRAPLRIQELNQFNHKFQKRTFDRIEQYENEPAYKRNGIELDNLEDSGALSRTSLDFDSNDDLQLRSNNSFLDDNVD